jgi:hypothetical protein
LKSLGATDVTVTLPGIDSGSVELDDNKLIAKLLLSFDTNTIEQFSFVLLADLGKLEARIVIPSIIVNSII